MKSDKGLEKALKKDIERGINSGEYPELFNGNDVVQLMLQSQLLGRKEGREQATSDILKKIDKLILNNEERDSSRVIKQNVRWELEELKQKIQGVGK